MSGLLRVCTAGSVDDGKSTLIGRLLHDSRSVYEDQISSVEKASKNRNAGPIDFSLFTDGLKAEREQGITIDVAYRYFATARRKFILADTPGHEQYTRNMATGASTADLAILLVDARNGVRVQSKRHARIAQAARHQSLRPGHQQDGPRRFRPRRVRRHLRRLRRAAARRHPASDSAQRAARRQRHHGERSHAVVRGAEPAPLSRNGGSRQGRDAESRSGFRCSSCRVPTRISAATRDRSSRARSGPATPSRSGRRAGRPPSRGSSPGTAIWTSRSRRCR